jgi:hypothetical protein
MSTRTEMRGAYVPSAQPLDVEGVQTTADIDELVGECEEEKRIYEDERDEDEGRVIRFSGDVGREAVGGCTEDDNSERDFAEDRQ